MAPKLRNSVTFSAAKAIQPICTGGNVAISQDGRILASSVEEDVLLSDIRTSQELARIEGDGEAATSIALTPSASHLIICSRSLSLRIYALTFSDLEDKIEAELLRTLKPHATPVIVSAIDRTGTLLATGGADGIVKVWDIRGGYITHTFHGHSGVISALHFFEVDSHTTAELEVSKKRKRKSREAETNGNDEQGFTLGYRLASGGEDGKVRIWNLHKRASAAVLDAHVSVVRSLDYSAEENILLSASRDKTVATWDSRSWKARNTTAILEEVESAGFLQKGRIFYTGGETARLRLWDAETGREITVEQEGGTETEVIQQVILYSDWSYLISVHADQILTLRSLEPLESLAAGATIQCLPIIRRICGSHDQIIDLAYVGGDKNLLALGTNSEDVRIVSIQENLEARDQQDGSHFGSEVALLKGHDDIVIAMDVDWSGHWLATGAKDNTAKVWRLDPDSSSFECYATFTGHAESLGALGLPKARPPEDSAAYRQPLFNPPNFLITGSQDQTIKKWNIKAQNTGNDTNSSKSVYTRKAHDKDINAIAVHHASHLFASASQDKTVKLWSTEDGSTVGILKGHRRGVWSVAFSNPGLNLNIAGAAGTSSGKGFVLTGSGDKTVKIWSLADYSCLMTMEGHTNSVLKVAWLPPTAGVLPNVDEDGDEDLDGHAFAVAPEKRGPLVASAAADGLVKVWDAQTGECAATLDNHTDRVWALAVRPPSTRSSKVGDNSIGESLVSGGADGVLTFWVDTTATTVLESRARESKQVELQQELENFVHGKNWREAIALALQLDQPGRLLHLFKTVVEADDFDRESCTGSKEVDEVVATLAEEQVFKLLLRVRDWNTNARNFLVGQRVLRAIVDAFGVERLAQMSTRGGKSRAGVKQVMEGLRVYGERHFSRVSDMCDESYLVEFTLGEMDEVLGADIDSSIDDLLSGKEIGRPNGARRRDEDYMMLEA